MGVRVVIAALAALAVAAPAASAASPLDLTFGGGDGIATFDALAGSGDDSAEDVLVQPDGKIVVGANGADTTGLFVILRLNPDGTPDTSFGPGHDGRIAISHGEFANRLNGIGLQPDGKIVAVGSATGSTNDVAVARVDASGNLDSTFAGDGTTTFDIGNSSNIGRDVAFQPGGKIVIATGAGAVGDQKFALLRLEANGALDDGGVDDPNPGDSFQGTGSTVVDVGVGGDFVSAMLQQPDGKIVLGGYADVDPAADTSGSASGRDYDFALVRLEADGDVDAGFGNGGRRVVAFNLGGPYWDTLAGIARQADGKIVAVGMALAGPPTTFETARWAIARVTEGGALDDTGPGAFSEDGKLAFTHGSPGPSATDVDVQPDGKIVAVGEAGRADGSLDLGAARLTPSGAFDESFGTAGLAAVPVGSGSIANAMVLAGDKIVVAGVTTPDGLSEDVVVARLLQSDADGDGIGDAEDNCPANSNTDQRNSDGRGAADACNADADADERDDDADNCAAAANPDQADGDGDGQGDACDSPAPPPDATAGAPTACLTLTPAIRKRTKVVPGGGEVALTSSQTADAVVPLKLAVGARRGVKVKSLAFKVNKKAIPTTSTKALSVPLARLKIGSRNAISVVVTLTNKKKVTVNDVVTLTKCELPPVTCERLAGGAQLRCSSTMPLRARRVTVTVFGADGRKATSSAPVTAKKGAKKGSYTLTMKTPVTFLPGRYVYKHLATTTRKGERLLAVRVLNLK
jgi:uncharacterized delta-60 repeat protein